MHWGIIGSGGHGKVVLEAIKSFYPDSQVTFFSKDLPEHSFFHPYRIIADHEDMIKLYEHSIDSWHVAIGDIITREKKIHQLKKQKLVIAPIFHTHSIVSPTASVDEGTLINAGAVINASAIIGRGCIINTSASIDHDCIINDFVNIGPGCHLAGNVIVGEKSDLGIGVAAVPSVRIGKGCIIGAGSIVIKDIPDFSLAYGVPAKVIKNLEKRN